MVTSRDRHDEEQPYGEPHRSLLTAEALRSGGSTPHVYGKQAKTEERITIFWRVFGGTLLSIAALVCMTLYQQFSNNVTELRTNVNRLTESRADFIKLEDCNTRFTAMWNVVKELQASNASLLALKERSVLLEQQVKTAEEERKELVRELQQLRERQAVVEGRQAATPPPGTPSPRNK